jgi:hypothetical protein
MAYEAAGDLLDVRKVMRSPAREQLRERDGTEFRVKAGSLEIGLRNVEGFELRDIGVTQALELVQYRDAVPSRISKESALTIEWSEPLVLFRPEDELHSRHPVSDLGVRDVTEDLVRTPRAGLLVELQRIRRGTFDERAND